MSELGKRLVRSLLVERDMEVLAAQGVGEGDLFGDARDAFRWAMSFLRERGEWPTASQVEEGTGILLPEHLDKLDYITDLIRRRTLGKAIESGVVEVSKLIGERKPDEALRLLTETGVRLRARSTSVGVDSFRATGGERLAYYEAVKATGGLLGQPTPWPSLNKRIMGWVDGCLHVVTAMQNMGKTWFACIVAADALARGKRVLFVSMEMANDRIARRVAAVRYRVPWGKFLRCELEEATERELATYAAADKEGEGDILFADKKRVKRVADVVALTLDNRPDIVVVDGGYRFRPGASTGGQWESTVEIVAQLQEAAEATGPPWIVTTQQGDASETGKEKKPGTKMRAWNVRYGKEWVINPDIVLGLAQTDLQRLDGVMELHLLKERDAAADEKRRPFFNIHWDFKGMDFSERDSLELSKETTFAPVGSDSEVEY